MNENRVVVFDEEREKIIHWISKHYNNNLEPNMNASGYFCGLHNIIGVNGNKEENEGIFYILNDVRNRVIEKENLQKYKTCNELPDLIYYMEPGTKLHDHDDSGYKNTNSGIQIRFNVCIQKPEEGGRPIYAGKLLDMVEGEYVICRAEIDRHTSEWIKGNIPKINLSLGFIIDHEDVHLFSNREKIIVENVNCNDVVCIDLNNNNNDKLWLTENALDNFGIECNKKYLLDYNKINNSQIEMYIHNIAILSLKENFINFNSFIHKIEFSFYNNINDNNNGFNIEYDRSNKNYPVLTSITYLKNYDGCLVITNIDLDSYKYKEIPIENGFFLSKINENYCIAFDSSKYYGILNMKENNNHDVSLPFYLKINIWESLPKNIEYFNYVTDNSISYNENNKVDIDYKVLTTEEYGYKKISNNIIDRLFYNSDIRVEIKNIRDVFSNETKSIIKVENKCVEKLNYDELFKTYGDLTYDLLPFMNSSTIKSINRFYNSKILLNVLSKDVCFWIINESEKVDKWIDSPYGNYGKYLNIEKMPAVSNFIFFSSNYYTMQLSKSYDLNEKINFNITDVFITKYDTNIAIKNEKTADQSHFTLIIQLNDNNDYEGGEITFINSDPYNIDENKILLKQGDMLIYNYCKLRNNGGVTKGEKYCIVFLINIII